MKCKKHLYEQGVGVCASCLRERLLTLIAAQNEIPPENDHRSSDRPPPPPVLFPRSVSPYVSHRRSVDSDVSDADCRRHRRFYHTPQVQNHGPDEGKSSGFRRFSLLNSIFGHHHRSDESELAGSGSGSSSSWFSSLIHRRRKKKKKKRRSRLTEESEAPARAAKSFAVVDRGMSPVNGEETDDCASESGYSTESSTGWRRSTPARGAPHCRRGGGALSGFGVCFSPLVRPSPAGQRHPPPEVGFSGDLRTNLNSTENRNVSVGTGSFGPNRSRKLANPGRFR